MKTEITSVNIRIKLPMKLARRLCFETDFFKLQAAFKDLGLQDINYDGHFGPHFFCSCQQKDIPEIERRLVQILKDKSCAGSDY